MSTQFSCQKHYYFKLFSLVKQFYFKQFSLVKYSFCLRAVKCQKQFHFKQSSLAYTNSSIQTIQLSIDTHFSSVWPIDRTLSDANSPGQSWPGSDGSERVLCILQSSSITRTSPSYCLVSYPEHSLGRDLTRQQRSSQCTLQPQPTWQDDNDIYVLCVQNRKKREVFREWFYLFKYICFSF